MPLRQGTSAFLKFYPLNKNPAEKLKTPIIHHVKFSWKPMYMTSEGNSTLKSDSFSLGDDSLKAHLELEMNTGNFLQLYLQVATKHVDGIIGRVIFDVDGKDPFSVDLEVAIIDGNQKQEVAPKELKIIKDFGSLLSNNDTTDITLKVGTTELRAHKFMLSTRSPVLKAMLSADMLEKKTGVIELPNMSVAAANAFLSFIYTARIEEKKLKETAEELLAAATMYDMPDLLAYSEYALREMISMENVGRLLQLACLHDAVMLKIQAFFFFKINKAAVTASEGWKEVVAANPTVMIEAIMDIV